MELQKICSIYQRYPIHDLDILFLKLRSLFIATPMGMKANT